MLHVQIGKSVIFAVALLSGHALAVVSIVVSLPPVAALFGGAAIAVSALHCLRLDALQYSAGAIVELRLREGGSCELLTRDGRTLTGQVQGSTFVSPWLIVVNIRLEPGRRRSLILARDSAGAQVLRELRVWLRYRCNGKPPESSVL